MKKNDLYFLKNVLSFIAPLIVTPHFLCYFCTRSLTLLQKISRSNTCRNEHMVQYKISFIQKEIKHSRPADTWQTCTCRRWFHMLCSKPSQSPGLPCQWSHRRAHLHRRCVPGSIGPGRRPGTRWHWEGRWWGRRRRWSGGSHQHQEGEAEIS